MVQTQTPYRVKGVFLETCNCDAGCNCNFGGFPDHGPCEALIGIMVNEGTFGDVDLSGVNYISSAGWGIFIGEIKDIRHRGGDLKLCGMVGDVHEVFQLLEFHSILQAYPTSDDAVSSFENHRS